MKYLVVLLACFSLGCAGAGFNIAGVDAKVSADFTPPSTVTMGGDVTVDLLALVCMVPRPDFFPMPCPDGVE